MACNYRYGDTKPFSAAFKSGVAVALRDAVFLDSADSYKVKPASSKTWVSAVAAPSAPTLADVALAFGSGLTNALTGAKVAYIFPWGEGTLSSAGTGTPTANGGLELAAIALPSPAVRLAVYVETAAGSGTYKLYRETYGEQIVITGYGVGREPPTAAAQDATAQTQYAFAQVFAGMSAQRYDGTNDTAYGIKDAKLRVDAAGVYEFDCASASFNPGDWVGMAKQSGNLLENQKVVAVTHRDLAIGRVAKAGTSVTKVLVEVLPKYMLAA